MNAPGAAADCPVGMKETVLRRARMGYCHWGAAEFRAVLSGWTGRAADAPERLTQRLAALGYGDVRLVNRGKTGLVLALQVMKAAAPERRKVLVPAYCCPAVPHAVREAGLDPVPVPVGDDLNLDLPALPGWLARDVLAVVAVHMYGARVDVDAIAGLARPHGIRVVDDAAHVLGDSMGTRGDFGLLSFDQSKTLTGGMPNGGGALLVNAPEFRPAVTSAWEALPDAPLRRRHHAWFAYAFILDPLPRFLPNYGARFVRPVARWCEARVDRRSHISDTAAAAVLAQLERLGDIRAARTRLCGWYADALPNGVRMPQYAPGAYRTRMIVTWDGGASAKGVQERLIGAGISVRAPYRAWSDEAAAMLGSRLDRMIELPGNIRLREADVRRITAELARAIA